MDIVWRSISPAHAKPLALLEGLKYALIRILFSGLKSGLSTRKKKALNLGPITRLRTCPLSHRARAHFAISDAKRAKITRKRQEGLGLKADVCAFVEFRYR